MFTINRYIFKRLFSTFVVFMVSLLGVVWLTQALRFLDVIVNNNVQISSFLTLIIYLIPDLTVTLLPSCLLVACIMSYQRTVQDHEMIAMRSIGLSHTQIAKPFLILGILGTCFMLLTNIYVVPSSFQKFRQQEHKLKNQFSFSMLKPGNFNVFKNTTIYIREQDKKNNFKGVFIQYEQENKNAPPSLVTILAKNGSVSKVKDQIILKLKKGQRQERSHDGRLSMLSFDKLAYNLNKLNTFIEERHIKPYEKSIMELFETDTSLSKLANKRLRIEAHQRILLPFMALISALIVLIVHQDMNLTRHRKRYRGIASLLLGVSAQAFLYMLLNLYTKANLFLPLAYIYTGTLIVLGLLKLQQRTIK